MKENTGSEAASIKTTNGLGAKRWRKPHVIHITLSSSS
jgi:hypothetical protein